jgi:hypothetical protein
LKTAADVSQHCGETVRLWATRHVVVSRKIGGRWWIDVRDLVRVLRARAL